VKTSTGLGPTALKDQSFFAGWMALRQFNDPKTAEIHFNTLRKASDGPLSLAKANYWLGRTAEAQGDVKRAGSHYKAASQYTDTFFGQLASQRLAPADQHLDVGPFKSPSAEDIRNFNETDAVKAVVLARKSGLDNTMIRAFLIHLARHFKTETEIAMVTHLAEALGDTQIAVRIGKASIARGYNVMAYAYPIHKLPAFPMLRVPPEPAFLLGIARQESEFNPNTLSGAGARGLLQVMPVTANHVCKDYKIRCDIPRLMTDTAYNTMMGSAYIADRMSEFKGSYVLGIAGYNAGPGRARQWIREFGDPRDPNVDVVDWIMRIPFEETRDYVQKVLANIQVYRARLGESKTALRLNDDIKRARGLQRAAVEAEPTSAEPIANARPLGLAGLNVVEPASDDMRRALAAVAKSVVAMPPHLAGASVAQAPVSPPAAALSASKGPAVTVDTVATSRVSAISRVAAPTTTKARDRVVPVRTSPVTTNGIGTYTIPPTGGASTPAPTADPASPVPPPVTAKHTEPVDPHAATAFR
jgi:soluble lytic murein transglycosylase-like protein